MLKDFTESKKVKKSPCKLADENTVNISPHSKNRYEKYYKKKSNKDSCNAVKKTETRFSYAV